MSDKKSCWWPVTSGAPLRLIRGPISLNIFVNGLDDGTESILSKFMGDTKVGGVGGGCAAL